ncbi:MAG: hypothetical protein JSU72_00800 [Deltaproteobacteria bacterium]|nr:MAG: hypothetical protein JSU72_00800 [Deltaproteobacteria bacterium]
MSAARLIQANHIKLIFLMVTILIFPLTGCQTTPKRHGLLRKAPLIKVSGEELRIRVRYLAGTFSGTIEEAADQIIASSSDADIRRQALLWKTNAIPASYGVIFQPDPAAALLDTWAFTVQMVHYFEEGPGREKLGQYHYIALEASKRLETKVADLARSITTTGDISIPKKIAYEWAGDHPIRGPQFSRESLVSEFAEVLATEELSAFEAVGQLTIGMDDLAGQLTIYSEYLPRMARWQAELVLDEVVVKEGVRVTVEELNQLAVSLARVTSVLEQSPDIIAREREATLKALRRERVAVLKSIDDQRVATLRWLTKERIAATDSLTNERIAALAVLREERIDTLQEIEAMSYRIVAASLGESKVLIDHFFLRTAQLVGALLVGCLIISAVVTRGMKKKALG